MVRFLTLLLLRPTANVLAEFNLQKDGEEAYATFGDALKHKALKMIINTESS